MENVEENQEKLLREGGKCKSTVKKTEDFFFQIFFLRVTFSKPLKVFCIYQIGHFYPEKATITLGKKTRKKILPSLKKIPIRPLVKKSKK